MGSDEFAAAIAGNAIAGVAVWIVTGALVWAVGLVRARRRRRREIIALVNRAHAIAHSAVSIGLYDQSWIAGSDAPLREAKARYDDLTAQALNLFEPRETDVAFWCAVELYAGWLSPLEELERRGVPRKKPKGGGTLVSFDSLDWGWVLPRAELLADWANVLWPWDVGSARGPEYATRYTAGDRSRHGLVAPNSDDSGDMLRAYANLVRPPRWQPSKRRARQLKRMFPNEAAECSF
ncbi:hypothetical protein AB0E56_11175 [Microbacterium sp. NPDC028030]|uniref:hypothetical protein n=1 Tax=Microbacterium sp. NPDC028030 TaxID=3155124 RepID=UPI0033FAF0FB